MQQQQSPDDALYQELNKQYSPKRWCPRGEPEFILSEHFRFVKEESARVRAEVPLLESVRVGPGPRQLIDIFAGPQLPADAPVLVHIHGGYWQLLNREESAYTVRPLHNAGIVVAVVGYDLTPQVKVSEIVEEIQAAVEYMLNFARKRGSRGVWVSGHSAGAHLSASLLSPWLDRLEADTRRLLRGLVLVSGIYRLAPLLHTFVNEKLRLTREEADAVSPTLASYHLSPESMASIKKMRILVVLGQHESPAYHEQSREFAEILGGICDDVEHYVATDMDHFNVVEDLHKDDYILTKKIIAMIKSSDA